MVLEEIYQASLDSKRFFRHQAILYVGSESYDAPTITVLQGLNRLGFEIYTIKKPNINSWFCNKVLNDPRRMKFDFVLSNLHWGTRWSYYETYKLNGYLKVLIDGDDNPGVRSWKEKYALYSREYIYEPPEAIKSLEIMPYRWVEPIEDYKPDIVFTSQKRFDDKQSIYLPFGIRHQYSAFYEGRAGNNRDIYLTHITGVGMERVRTERLIRRFKSLHLIPGRILNCSVRGDVIIPEAIRQQATLDKGVHGYWRWSKSKEYFEVLNRTKVFVYPGVQTDQWWDSERIWEAYASGCFVLLKKPTVDVSQYPVTELCEFAVYKSVLEFVEKCWFLYLRQSFLEKLRSATFEKAMKYFSSVPLANYFLAMIHQKEGS